MYEKLQEWFNENKPDDNLIYKNGLADQVVFVRDKISGIFARSYEEVVGIRERIIVISTHVSKSVTLPVFQLGWNGYTFIMRYNFHNWKVSVKTPYGVSLKGVDFMNLFKEDKKIHEWACEGFEPRYVYGPFSENQEEFTIEIVSTYQLFTFFWILKEAVLKGGNNECIN